MASPISVRGLGTSKHPSDEYAIVPMYFPGKDKDGNPVMAKITREVHLVDDLKANMLIGNDLIGPVEIAINVASKSAIRAVENPGNSSGQHLVKFIIIFIEKLRSKGVEVELHWVPAHIGIDGNESADIAAKQATGWRPKKNKRGKLVEYDSKHTAKPAMLARPLKNAQKSTLAKDAHKQWTKHWKENDKGRGLYALQPTPSKAVLKLHVGLPKDLGSLAVQMRTGKIGLRLFLHRRRVPGIDPERCQCRQGPQTVAYILFTCRKFTDLRRGLWKEEMKRAMWGELCWKTVLTNAFSLKKAAMFMKDTGLFGQFRAHNEEDN
jgi:hypothetical protein